MDNIQIEKAYFAGGCFWCMEAVFKLVPGVNRVTPGYSGGQEADPSYEQVSSGETGHAEAVMVEFDPEVASYSDLLDVFFESHDPTQVNRQGNDVGPQYRSAVFCSSAQQKELAEKKIEHLEQTGLFDKPIATKIENLRIFYPAEEEHRDFYIRNQNNPYCQLVISPKLEKLRVTRLGATEKPFAGKYVNEKSDGIYHCSSCGTQLFSSNTKFDSGTGWPSFTDPVNQENIELKEDLSEGMARTEVKCKKCGAHLGHVFNDGPGDNGKRYCINSVCLDLEKT